jgi:hypothetical protein
VLSKPLKPFDYCSLGEETIWTKICDTICWPFRRSYRFCSKYSRRLKRCWDYAKFGWGNFDFDGEYLTDLITFKLKRIQRELEHGSSIQDEKYMQALRLAIRIGDKLDTYYYHWFLDRHDAKWGRPDMCLEDSEHEHKGEKLRVMHFERPNVVDDATREQEREEFIAAYEADDAMRLRDARWFFRLIEKYYPGWWD